MKEIIKRELGCLLNTKKQYRNDNYKSYLDMVKGLAIILVVLGHSGAINHSTNLWLSTFHLPTFFIISGILVNLKKEKQLAFNTFIINKFKQILIPYFCFSFISIIFILINIFANTLKWTDLAKLICQTFSLQGYSAMWFLPVLFFAELFLMSVLKFLDKINNKFAPFILCVFTTILAILIYNLYNNYIVIRFSNFFVDELRIFFKAIVGSAFISYGYLIWDIFLIVDNGKRIGIKKIICKTFQLFVGVILFSLNILVLPYIQFMDLNNLNVGSIQQYLLLGVGGGLSLLLICKNIPNIPIISYCGQNSLIIMCTHLNFYILFISLFICQFIASRLPGNYNILWCLTSMICTICLEIALIIIIKNYFPFILGKKRK